jgi:hypothetical protein
LKYYGVYRTKRRGDSEWVELMYVNSMPKKSWEGDIYGRNLDR